MLRSNNNIVGVLAIVLLAAPHAYAIDDTDTPNEINQRIGTGDPVIGKDKSALCQGCHGEDGNSVSGDFPKLSGQWADYIQKQVREFQNGARYNEVMTDMAMSVNDFHDLFDIAAYFASQKQMGSTPIEDEAEQKLYQEGDKLFNYGNQRTGAFRCVKCHGEHGRGQPLNNHLFPVIGGQHKAYLIKQLTDFKHEVRENDRSGMMLRITTHLTDHDIEALATYLSRVPPPPPPPAPAPVAVAEPAPAPIPVTWKTLLEEKPVTIEGINFIVGSAKLKSKTIKTLEEVVGFAHQHPDAKLELIGYTDTSGSVKLNQRLSLARAETVKKYLVKKGVPATRVATKGEGPANPIADNKTKDGRAKNRRVEIHSVIKEEKKVRVTAG
jgi:outer membrane protein OmpA-like peptidoglycan-associated protein